MNIDASRTAFTITGVNIHPSIGKGRMDVHPGDGDCRGVRGEGFVLDLATRHPVERVRDHRADLRRFEVLDAVADFLVAGEDDPHRPVRDRRVLRQDSGHLHDDREPGLVVGPE